MDKSIMTKPTVVIYTADGISEIELAPLLYGMEEEGIPWYIEGKDEQTELELADLASQDSALAVGVGVTGETIALTYKNLPADKFIFRLFNYKCESKALRILGCDAARLAKGSAFKFHERLEVAF